MERCCSNSTGIKQSEGVETMPNASFTLAGDALCFVDGWPVRQRLAAAAAATEPRGRYVVAYSGFNARVTFTLIFTLVERQNHQQTEAAAVTSIHLAVLVRFPFDYFIRLLLSLQLDPPSMLLLIPLASLSSLARCCRRCYDETLQRLSLPAMVNPFKS